MSDYISRQAAIDAPFKKFDADTGVTWIPLEHIEQLPSAQPEQRWIPCSKRVPEEDEQVLVYLHDSPYIAWIDSNGEWNTEDFTLDKEEDREDEPIAWMPLPEPWKGEK